LAVILNNPALDLDAPIIDNVGDALRCSLGK
jgi:hypothetical protein